MISSAFGSMMIKSIVVCMVLVVVTSAQQNLPPGPQNGFNNPAIGQPGFNNNPIGQPGFNNNPVGQPGFNGAPGPFSGQPGGAQGFGQGVFVGPNGIPPGGYQTSDGPSGSGGYQGPNGGWSYNYNTYGAASETNMPKMTLLLIISVGAVLAAKNMLL